MAPSGAGVVERYRLQLTDGVVNTTGMLGTTFKAQMDNNEIPLYSIICLNDYICNDVGGTKYVRKKSFISPSSLLSLFFPPYFVDLQSYRDY
jgi:Replication factor-A protein 1, N-terminal domain